MDIDLGLKCIGLDYGLDNSQVCLAEKAEQRKHTIDAINSFVDIIPKMMYKDKYRPKIRAVAAKTIDLIYSKDRGDHLQGEGLEGITGYLYRIIRAERMEKEEKGGGITKLKNWENKFGPIWPENWFYEFTGKKESEVIGILNWKNPRKGQ